MGIYLTNMEMPKEGEYRMTLYVCSDGSAYIDVASFPVDEDRFEAVPVPPHGDLVDINEAAGAVCCFDGDAWLDTERVSVIIPSEPCKEDKP